LKVYIIGSMRNPLVPETANALRGEGHEVYDDWHASGPESDDYWMAYERAKGHDYLTALDGWAARHIFENDLQHLTEAEAVVLVHPAGRSAHLELGWAIGQGKLPFILMPEEPDRWDVMARFALDAGGDIVYTVQDLLEAMPEEV
jgi:hypothetical protein